MRVIIGPSAFTVEFRHSLLPFHDVRKAPTVTQYREAMSSLIDVLLEDADDPQALARAVKLEEQYVGSCYPDSHMTECFIRGAESKQDIAYGQATCSKDDRFDRAMGRAVSFLKALQVFPAPLQNTYIAAYIDSGIGLPNISDLVFFAYKRPWQPLAMRFANTILGFELVL